MMKPAIFTLFVVAGTLGCSQDVATARMTVTVEAVHGKEVPDLAREDVMVFQGKQRLTVTEWTALKGEQAGRELFILIDDTSGMSLGSQLADLKEFINDQPASTLIGVAYLRNDIADVKQILTADHAKAAAALRLPIGSAAGTSPYLALSDLLKRWATCCVPREVLLISSGVDPLGGDGPINAYLDTTIEQAQRAGVIIYAIYAPRAGHGGHSAWRINWGQNHLSQLTEETGGEAYMLGYGPLVSFAPYLSDMTQHIAHQYSVAFTVKQPPKSGMIPVRFATEVPNAEIVAAPKVYLPKKAPPSGE